MDFSSEDDKIVEKHRGSVDVQRSVNTNLRKNPERWKTSGEGVEMGPKYYQQEYSSKVVNTKAVDKDDDWASQTSPSWGKHNSNLKDVDVDEYLEPADQSPIEEVALTVSTTDDPTIPVYTFRMWTLGLVSCASLAFVNQFFAYRTEPLSISAVAAQIAALPLGRFMASTLPARKIFKGTWAEFSLNPSPFNMKEHVLITIFANAGSGGAYAILIVTIVKAFYHRKISFLASLTITITTQMLGYGWAGLFRNFLVKPARMWWPSNLVQVSLFRTMHEVDIRPNRGFTRLQFFMTVLCLSFAWYTLPGYLFPMLTSISWVCWVWPKSITAQQLGSGISGFGIGAITLDWSAVSSFLGSPLAYPFFALVNTFVGYVFVVYVLTPLMYFNDVYSAKSFPLISSSLFDSQGQQYNISRVVNDKFELDIEAYNDYGKLHLSSIFIFTYGLSFASLTAMLTHVILYHGKNIWRQTLLSINYEIEEDVHTRLMRAYPEVPQWWFHFLLVLFVALSIGAGEYFKEELQLPWWGILLACTIAMIFTLPIGILVATTNLAPYLNVLSEYLIGYIYPGRPVANVLFKTYSTISPGQAIYFLSDFKLGHYMKIPPRAMFSVQIVGTLVAAVVNLATAWFLLTTVENICNKEQLPPNSPWTCPGDRVFYSASVIWGLIGPKRIFGPDGLYGKMNWFFAFGAVAPIPVWLATKWWPRQRWISLINVPIMIIGSSAIPPASTVNYNSWFVVGFIFNYVIFKYRKKWWTRYNYILSAGLDAGLAFMGVAIYFALGSEQKGVTWWGTALDNCPLANCPTAPGIVVSGC